jgi:hypothetical protein
LPSRHIGIRYIDSGFHGLHIVGVIELIRWHPFNFTLVSLILQMGKGLALLRMKNLIFIRRTEIKVNNITSAPSPDVKSDQERSY